MPPQTKETNNAADAQADETQTPSLPYTDEEINAAKAKAYEQWALTKGGGAVAVGRKAFDQMVERGEVDIGLFVGDPESNIAIKDWLRKHNPHPLTIEQEEELRRNINAEFGPPKLDW